MSTFELPFSVGKIAQQLIELVAIVENFGSILRTCIIQSQWHEFTLGYPNPVSSIHRHQAHKWYKHIQACVFIYLK